jgi:nicotinamidase-related amidase
MDASERCLLLIDVQRAFDDPRDGRRSTPDAERTIARLLAAWREAGWPVVHVHHASTEPDSPLRPDRPGYAVQPEARPLDGEPVFVKHVNSAFIGTELEAFLHDRAWRRLTVVGFTTDHCVSTTVRMAGNLGFDVELVADACASYARRAPDGTVVDAATVHRVQLASLDGEFCRVVASGTVLTRLAAAATDEDAAAAGASSQS